MAEVHPHGVGEPFTYRGDLETWSRIIAFAEYIIGIDGTARENGTVDTDWNSDFLDMQFRLVRRSIQDKNSYILNFSQQLSDDDEAIIAFESNPTHITGLFGDIVERYTGKTADERFEQAEIELLGFLSTHPLVPQT